MAAAERTIPETLQGTRVLVIGFGRSGQGAAELLAAEGARVTVVDDDAVVRRNVDVRRWAQQGIPVHFGPIDPERVAGTDVMVVSPGVSPASPWMSWARKLGIPVAGEIEVAFWTAEAPIAAVTGTNGKSTTTELLGAIVREGGMPVEVGGNTGRALSGFAHRVPPNGWIVAEISSFQLETIHRFRPRVAIFLNLTPDHLDRYLSLDEYQRAKERMFENQTGDDLAVLNRDDPRLRSTGDRIRAEVLETSLRVPVNEGAWVEKGRIVARISGRRFEVCPAAELVLRGPHNLANALAVVAAALWMGISPEVVAGVLRSFGSLSHRMELLGEVGGVEFVNDSKATNVEAVVSALVSFTAPVILIAGGLGKGLDFAALAEASRGRVKRAILMGEAREEISHVLEKVTDVEFAGSMSEAVDRAMDVADPGEIVLLSPACASFDMFRNFEDRGNAFRAEVERLRDGSA
ncbi:MAG: UDP-N-acetylmuramoyl-L-alanine--D-glutamate ligase [Candidatus Eisenbacteria sp.]|nr:UDP-N-acetylmuramoyl-L-alanine--D-glutamate ligase [Candidatus Eisenbacteria bacterium]